MSLKVKEPILVIGLGGVGTKLAIKAKEALNSDCLLISNDRNDFVTEHQSIHISTESIVNPSVHLIRGSVFQAENEVRSKLAEYSTIILMSNLAGKGGSAIAPIVSKICKESGQKLVSFAIMPFKYEKDRIFNSGIALKRIRENSQCTIVLDNDSLLDSNPDLSAKTCYAIANSAILHVVKSLGSSEISSDTSILTTSKETADVEESLRDSLKMLYENAPPNTIKRSMLYVVGGQDIPVGVINSIANLTNGIIDENNTQVDMTSSSEKSKVVMMSSVQGMTKFDSYDPLGIIPQENTLDWNMPDCSIDCGLDLYQLE